eukprot:6353589-Prymnesium_polylepis.1
MCRKFRRTTWPLGGLFVCLFDPLGEGVGDQNTFELACHAHLHLHDTAPSPQPVLVCVPGTGTTPHVMICARLFTGRATSRTSERTALHDSASVVARRHSTAASSSSL